MIGMDPRTHPRGAPPDFTLPKPNPNPSRMTDALWWLVCMRERLEPTNSDNGGTFANKAGYHNAGENLPDHGAGNAKTDHSIRRAPDRTGAWWKKFSSAHDWTFRDAQAGKYATIDKYTTRLVNAMRDPNDLRPDDVYAYTLGQMDGDTVVEGYNEYTDDDETSADKTHNWHRHDSFRRNIIGQFWAMWKALTIDMGWTYGEWLRSTQGGDDLVTTQAEFDKLMDNWVIMRTSGSTVAPIPTVYGRLKAFPWQYSGGGTPAAGMSVLNTLTGVYQMVEKIAKEVNIDESELAAIRDAAREGAVTSVEAIIAGVIAGLPDDIDDRTKDVVKASLREVMLEGVAPDA